MKIVIVTGPQACGKTLNAEKIKKLFNASAIIDGGILSHDLVLAKSMVTSPTVNSKYQSLQDNPHYNTTVVVLTNEKVTIDPDARYLSSVHTFSSLNLGK